VVPATSEGVLKMPAPMTMPTMIAIASRHRRRGSGAALSILNRASTALPRVAEAVSDASR